MAWSSLNEAMAFVDVALALLGEAHALDRAAAHVGVGGRELGGEHRFVRVDRAGPVALVEEDARFAELGEQRRGRAGVLRRRLAVGREGRLGALVGRLVDLRGVVLFLFVGALVLGHHLAVLDGDAGDERVDRRGGRLLDLRGVDRVARGGDDAREDDPLDLAEVGADPLASGRRRARERVVHHLGGQEVDRARRLARLLAAALEELLGAGVLVARERRLGVGRGRSLAAALAAALDRVLAAASGAVVRGLHRSDGLVERRADVPHPQIFVVVVPVDAERLGDAMRGRVGLLAFLGSAVRFLALLGVSLRVAILIFGVVLAILVSHGGDSSRMVCGVNDAAGPRRRSSRLGQSLVIRASGRARAPTAREEAAAARR